MFDSYLFYFEEIINIQNKESKSTNLLETAITKNAKNFYIFILTTLKSVQLSFEIDSALFFAHSPSIYIE